MQLYRHYTLHNATRHVHCYSVQADEADAAYRPHQLVLYLLSALRASIWVTRI